jgi:hypothetical protein
MIDDRWHGNDARWTLFIFEHAPYFATASARQPLHHITERKWIKLTLSVSD